MPWNSGQTSSGQPHNGGVLNVRVPDDPGGWDLSLFKAYPAWELQQSVSLGNRSASFGAATQMLLREMGRPVPGN